MNQSNSPSLEFAVKVKDYLATSLDPADAEVIWQAGQLIVNLDTQALYYANVVRDVESICRGERAVATRDMDLYKWNPVAIQEFIESSKYLNKPGEVYPVVMRELIEINSGKYVEVVFTGGIGSGKTTAALYTIAYQLYLLSCLKNPHRLYGLDSSSEILFIFQSISAKLAKGVDFNRFKNMIEHSPYFMEKFPFNTDLESKLVFPNRIELHPVSGAETAAIGQNVIGGLIDELNYMAVIEKSKQSVDQGTYDQAVALYNSIARRRKSRFMRQGKMPGVLCLVSSKRYPGQFTDQKEEEAKRDPTIYVYDYRVWEIKPKGSFSGEMFNVYIGDVAHKPRVIKKDEFVEDAIRTKVMAIPVEFREEFDKDIINALREIAGVSTLARHPFLIDVEHVSEAFGAHLSIFSQDRVDFVETQLEIYPKRFFRPDLPRFVHIDLAISGDSCGFAIGTVLGFKSMLELGYGKNPDEYMPMIHYDGILEIKPPKNGEILFWKVREILNVLRVQGLNVRWVTFDSFQSKDSQQLLKQQAFVVGEISVDTDTKAYDTLKAAFYTDRVKAPSHPKCVRELISLEKDTKTGKIDHPPLGSKDCSDAMAGVAYGLTTRREIWAMYKVPLLIVPELVKMTDDGDVQSIATIEPEEDDYERRVRHSYHSV